MENVIQFPVSKRQEDIIKAKKRSAAISERKNREDETFYLEELNYEDCIVMSQFVAEELNEIINNNQFLDFEFKFLKNKESKEYQDMSVIINLLTAAFLRNKGIKHIFQEDLDELHTKIKYIQSENGLKDDTT